MVIFVNVMLDIHLIMVYVKIYVSQIKFSKITNVYVLQHISFIKQLVDNVLQIQLFQLINLLVFALNWIKFME